MAYPSGTRQTELEELVYLLLEDLKLHSHRTSELFAPVDFFDIQNVPTSLLSGITGLDYLIRNDRPKLVERDIDNNIVVLPTTIPDGIITEFKLAYVPIGSTVMVYVQGDRQRLGTNYSLNGEYINFTTAPPANSNIVVDYAPFALSPDPTVPIYLTNEIPFLQLGDFVLSKRSIPSTVQLYKQGLRLYQSGLQDFVMSSTQRIHFVDPIITSNILVDYQTANGGGDLYLKTHSFTSYLISNPTSTVFVLPEVPLADTEQVYIAGLRKTRNIDYSILADTITLLDTSLTLELTNILVDYQTNDPQVLIEYRNYQALSTLNQTIITLENVSSDVVLLNTPQVYISGNRKELGEDYTISGARNNVITLTTPQDINTKLIVDYQV